MRPRYCAPMPLLNALLCSNPCSPAARRSYASDRTSPPRCSQASVAPPLLAAPRRPSAHAPACDPDCPPPILRSFDAFVLLLSSCSSSSETPARIPQKPLLRRCKRTCSPSSADACSPVRPPPLLLTLLRNPCSHNSETRCSSTARDPPPLMLALLNALLRFCAPSSAPACAPQKPLHAFPLKPLLLRSCSSAPARPPPEPLLALLRNSLLLRCTRLHSRSFAPARTSETPTT